MNINTIVEKLLYAVKRHQPTGPFEERLQNLPLLELEQFLDSDDRKKAFWINIYNAYFQILRKEKRLEKPVVFTKKCISISRKKISLDDIEHGILRRNRIKWSLGYLPNPFAPANLKRLSLSKMDYRIHFALNCGAKGCPAIAFYQPDLVDRQLDTATATFLEAETEIFPDNREVHVTRLLLWFMADFGGRRGVRNLLEKKLGLDLRGYRIVFKPYDWEEKLLKFRKTNTLGIDE